eukprot:2074930-Pleurochrysis_carterae.AAC.2
MCVLVCVPAMCVLVCVPAKCVLVCVPAMCVLVCVPGTSVRAFMLTTCARECCVRECVPAMMRACVREVSCAYAAQACVLMACKESRRRGSRSSVVNCPEGTTHARARSNSCTRTCALPEANARVHNACAQTNAYDKRARTLHPRAPKTDATTGARTNTDTTQQLK